MPGRRETLTRDMRRNSTARKETHKKEIARQMQQADVLRKLVSQARAEEKAAG
jgi:hypothetical protein